MATGMEDSSENRVAAVRQGVHAGERRSYWLVDSADSASNTSGKAEGDDFLVVGDEQQDRGAVLQYCDGLFRHYPGHAGTRLAQRRGAAAELLGPDRPKHPEIVEKLCAFLHRVPSDDGRQESLARRPAQQGVAVTCPAGCRIGGRDIVQEKWLRQSEQGDKWNRCLIEGMIVLSETGARDEQTTPP